MALPRSRDGTYRPTAEESFRRAVAARRISITRLHGRVRPAAGRTPALACRLRAAPRRGRGPGEEGPERRGRRADGTRPPAVPRRKTEGRQGPPARAARRVGSRPPLVARPDGAREPAAGGAHGARLARLVRDVERRGGLAGPDAPAERPPPALLARPVRPPAARRHARPGDAALAIGNGQLQVVAERELRPGADGAVHPRRRPRLHRARRPRAGPRADGLPQRLEGGHRPISLPLRPRTPRRRRQARLRPPRAVRLARRLPALRPPPESPVVLRPQALELLHPDDAAAGNAEGPRAALRERPLRGQARRRGDPQAPAPLRRPADGQVADRLHGRPASRRRTRNRYPIVDVAVRQRRPAAVLPAERVRVERRALARHGQLPRAVGHRRPDHPPGGPRSGEGAGAVRRRQAAGPSS